MLYTGDCLEILPTLDAESVDSIVTDPPYGLNFMSANWDHGVPGVPFWRACLRVAKPGAMLLAFGGTRTHHRLMCAIEDAGWEIRDVLSWLYGSGFPKSYDISKGVDKAAGAEREVVSRTFHRRQSSVGGIMNVVEKPRFSTVDTPSTDAAKLWDGWGTALKPAWEPIILAMKPRDGTFVNNALAYGCAGLNIDGCRVVTNGRPHRGNHSTRPADTATSYDLGSRYKLGTTTQGRWPANLVLSHTPECRQVGTKRVKPGNGSGRCSGNTTDDKSMFGMRGKPVTYADPDGYETVTAWDCAPECPVRMLDEQSGELKSGGSGKQHASNGSMFVGTGGNARDVSDTGGASRFFYCAKASRSERTAGGEIENNHPCVKPLALCRWLCRLTKTPTGGVVLDPFMGSGSIGVAAIQEGREFIGIEKEQQYVSIARQRIDRIAPVQLTL